LSHHQQTIPISFPKIIKFRKTFHYSINELPQDRLFPSSNNISDGIFSDVLSLHCCKFTIRCEEYSHIFSCFIATSPYCDEFLRSLFKLWAYKMLLLMSLFPYCDVYILCYHLTMFEFFLWFRCLKTFKSLQVIWVWVSNFGMLPEHNSRSHVYSIGLFLSALCRASWKGCRNFIISESGVIFGGSPHSKTQRGVLEDKSPYLKFCGYTTASFWSIDNFLPQYSL